VLIDDLPRTTRAARELGLLALLYGRRTPHPYAHAVFDDWRALPRLLNGQAASTRC
jgi:hypothetical protein